MNMLALYKSSWQAIGFMFLKAMDYFKSTTRFCLKGVIFTLFGAGLIACKPQGSAPQPWVNIFDGESLAGWTPKISGEILGQDKRQTFRAEDGVLYVDYKNYDGFESDFGHLFYETKLSDYRLKLEYKFTGQQIAGGPSWARLNSGVMLHSQDPATMSTDQFFPVSVEAQFLAAFDEVPSRKTGNVCTPGSHIVLNGELEKTHCIDSVVQGPRVGEWVKFEADVKGGEYMKFYVNGALAFELTAPEFDAEDLDARLLQKETKSISSGFIALQAESHPLEFRNIYLMNRAAK